MTLFDPDAYTTRWRAPDRARRSPQGKVVPIVDVYADETWRLVVNSQPGVVHAERASVGIGAAVGHMAWCGLYGVPLTFEHGERVNGCLACLEAMKPGAGE